MSAFLREKRLLGVAILYVSSEVELDDTARNDVPKPYA